MKQPALRLRSHARPSSLRLTTSVVHFDQEAGPTIYSFGHPTRYQENEDLTSNPARESYTAIKQPALPRTAITSGFTTASNPVRRSYTAIKQPALPRTAIMPGLNSLFPHLVDDHYSRTTCACIFELPQALRLRPLQSRSQTYNLYLQSPDFAQCPPRRHLAARLVPRARVAATKRTPLTPFPFKARTPNGTPALGHFNQEARPLRAYPTGCPTRPTCCDQAGSSQRHCHRP